jgi:hypothetical protein
VTTVCSYGCRYAGSVFGKGVHLGARGTKGAEAPARTESIARQAHRGAYDGRTVTWVPVDWGEGPEGEVSLVAVLDRDLTDVEERARLYYSGKRGDPDGALGGYEVPEDLALYRWRDYLYVPVTAQERNLFRLERSYVVLGVLDPK